MERVRARFDWNLRAATPLPNWKRKFSDTSINENVKKAPENGIGSVQLHNILKGKVVSV